MPVPSFAEQVPELVAHVVQAIALTCLRIVVVVGQGFGTAIVWGIGHIVVGAVVVVGTAVVADTDHSNQI